MGESAEASGQPGLGGGRGRGRPSCGKIWSDDSEATWRPGMWVLDPQTTGGMWEELTPSAGQLPPPQPTPRAQAGGGGGERGPVP